jgi:NADH dehydrogenase [ubiquinone] 1 alpha subcomplex assembly factor 1
MPALIFILLAIFLTGASTDTMEIDFGTEKDGQNWRVINDGVMGGLSQGQVSFTPASAVFAGEVSLENNGGFSSFRSAYGSFDLLAFDTVELRVRGSGCAFGLTFSLSRRWFDPNFKQMFTPTAEWQTIELPLADFHVYQIGRKGRATMSKEAPGRCNSDGLHYPTKILVPSNWRWITSNSSNPLPKFGLLGLAAACAQ